MPGRWITQGKGSDAKHIMVKGGGTSPPADLEEPRETSVLEYPFPDPEVAELQKGISQLYATTDTEIDYLLHIKEDLRDLEPQFGDQEAFKELMAMVEVVFDSFVQLKQRIRNLNNKGVFEGFSTKYLETRITALKKESSTLLDYFRRLPEANTYEGEDIIRCEQVILQNLSTSEEIVGQLKDFQGVSIPDDNQRDSRDFSHLRRGALHRYLSSNPSSELTE